jgi:hypothetical protein
MERMMVVNKMTDHDRSSFNTPCFNYATLKHFDNIQIEKALDAFLNKKLLEDFIPYPLGLKENPPTAPINQSRSDKRKELEYRFSKYGYYDCIGFRIDKWGTPRDIGGECVLVDSKKDELTIKFETSHSPPLKFYSRLDLFGWDINAMYYTPESGGCGTFTFYDSHLSYQIPNNKEDIQKLIPKNIIDVFGEKITPYLNHTSLLKTEKMYLLKINNIINESGTPKLKDLS